MRWLVVWVTFAILPDDWGYAIAVIVLKPKWRVAIVDKIGLRLN
ncbi:MAG: hypothetical protein SW833_11435 [Cyanobacteriota bacterium]|nr:hypothetical protein [Cyanobacteriota bacterium]